MAIIGSLPNNITNGQTIDAVPLMVDFNWVVNQTNSNAAGLNQSNAFTQTNSGVSASAAANYPIVSQVQNNAFNWCGNSGGSANALTLTPVVATSAYAAGQEFIFKASATNTGSATVAVSGLATLTIQYGGANLIGGEIISANWYKVLVDASGTTCQLSNYIPAVAIQNQTFTAYTTGGVSTAYTLTTSPAIPSTPPTNVRFAVKFHTAAGATPTLAISGGTAKNLKYIDYTGTKQAVGSMQIPGVWQSDVYYDGTDYVMSKPNLEYYTTWTPSVGGNAVYTIQMGEAYKIGRLVTVSFALIINTIGTGSTNIISGLPFVAFNDSGLSIYAAPLTFSNLTIAVTSLFGAANSNSIYLYRTNGLQIASDAAFVMGNNTSISGSITYFS